MGRSRRCVCALVLVASCGRIGFDSAASDAAVAVVDGAPDANVPLGAWSVAATMTGSPATSSSTPITVSQAVAAGDLIIPHCRGNLGSAPTPIVYTIAPTGLVTLAPVITRYDPGSQYWNSFTYGVMAPATGASTTITFTTSSFQGPSDCLIFVFRGGNAAPSVVTISNTTGPAGGFVTCGPVASSNGGVVAYSAVRSTCADAPMSGPFVQLGTTFGNPFGAWAPADGTSASATLNDCGNSGGWICTALSLTP
jgi:hypothetical protein